MQPRAPFSQSPWFWIVLFIGLTGLLIFFLENQFPGTLSDSDNNANILRDLLWLVLLVPALALRWKAHPKSSLQHLAIWLMVFAGLTAIMTYREDAARIGARILGAAAPAAGIETEDGVQFTRAADGHFLIRADIDGERVMFLLDTGASSIVLTRRDAIRAGIQLEQLQFDQLVETANGIGSAASAEIQRLAVGPIVLGPIRVLVNDADMDQSLLGMEFLNRLSSWRVEGDRLTLRP